MIEPSLLDETRLTPEVFIDREIALLFQMVRDMREAGIEINATTLVFEAKRVKLGAGSLYDQLGVARLHEILAAGINTAGFVYYENKLLEEARRRRIESISVLAASAADETSDIGEIEAKIRCQLDRSDEHVSQHTASWKEIGRDYVADIGQKKPAANVFTGLQSVDEATGGYLPGENIVIAARPGCGKTALATQIAVHNARKGRPVLYVSLEMKKRELFNRVACGTADVDSRLVRTRRLTESERKSLETVSEQQAEWPLHVFDVAGANVEQIFGAARLVNRSQKLALIVVDYLGLIECNKGQTRYEQISYVSRSLKRLAGELDSVVLSLCQLNREADGTRPRLSNLRDSGSIEQDADVVKFIHTDPQEGNLLIVEKHRHGDVGDIKLNFDRSRTRFTDPEQGYRWAGT